MYPVQRRLKSEKHISEEPGSMLEDSAAIACVQERLHSPPWLIEAQAALSGSAAGTGVLE
jgi:hypothetical protein